MSPLHILLFLVCFIIGSIPTGYIIVKKAKGVDIRQEGSGNVGATNAYRSLGLTWGILVALADILKGAFAVLFVSYFAEMTFLPLLGGIISILGHNYSIFLGFKGGKGVATTCGVLLALLPMPTLFALLFWIFLVITTRYVSIASIVASLSFLPLVYFLGYPLSFMIFSLILAFFVVYRHKDNIERLLKGEENRIQWPPTSGRGRVK